jgi:hypothetical protein
MNAASSPSLSTLGASRPLQMRLFLTICSLFVFLTVVGQTKVVNRQNVNPYGKESELRLQKEVDSSYLATTYRIDAGFEGQTLTINNNGTFKEASYSCDGKVPTDSGTWKFHQGALILDNSKTKYTYDFVSFRDILFLVDRKARQKFIKEFQRAIKEVREDKEQEKDVRFSASVIRSMNILYYHKWLD